MKCLEYFRKDYEIGNQIGKGAFGVVFKGQRRSDSTPVAIKVTNFRLLPFEELKDYARKEIILLKVFNNRPKSNIIQLFDSREEDEELVLVLELCQVEVFEFLVNYFPKGMNDELAQHVLEQILVAVECLHQENIIHRDLKLENVLLSVDDVFFQQFQHKQIDAENLILQGKIRIIDLGVSQVVKELTQTYTGSRYTMAPEITKGLAYGNLVDIFSVGTIFYQLLTGKFLYSQPNFQKYINEPSTIRKDQHLKDKTVLSYVLLEMMINEKPENRSSAGQTLNEIRKHSPQVQGQQIVDCLPKSNKDQNENHQPNPVKNPTKIKLISLPVESPQKTEKQNPNLAHQSLEFNLVQIPSVYQLPDLEQSRIEEDVQSIEQLQYQRKAKLRPNYQTELSPQKMPLQPNVEPPNTIQNIDNDFQLQEILSQQSGNNVQTEINVEKNQSKSSIVPMDQRSNIDFPETKQPNKHATVQQQCQAWPKDTSRVVGSSNQELSIIEMQITEYEQRRDLYLSIVKCYQAFSLIKNVTQTKFTVGLYFARNEANQLQMDITYQPMVESKLQQFSRLMKGGVLYEQVKDDVNTINDKLGTFSSCQFQKTDQIYMRPLFQAKCKKVLKLLANEEARYIQGIQVVNQLSLYQQMVRLIRLMICYGFTNISPKGIPFESLINSWQSEDRETVYKLLLALDLGIQTNIFNNWVFDKDWHNDKQRQQQDFYEINRKLLVEQQPQLSNQAQTDLDNLKNMQISYQLLSRTYLSLLKLQGTLPDIDFAEDFFYALPLAVTKARELMHSMELNTNVEIGTWINQQHQYVVSDLESLLTLQSQYQPFVINFRGSESLETMKQKFLSILSNLANQESLLLYKDSPTKRDIYLALANTLYLCIAFTWLPVGPVIVDLEEQTNLDNLLARSEVYRFLILNEQSLGIEIYQFEGWLEYSNFREQQQDKTQLMI